MPANLSSILALDVGAKRVGVAIASIEVQLPRPLITLEHDDTLFPTLETIVEVEAVKRLVVGFPRGMQGQHTAQTTAIEDFVGELKQHIALPVIMQDEALTSKHAEDELRARGKPYEKGDIDSLAATYILDDYIKELREKAA